MHRSRLTARSNDICTSSDSSKSTDVCRHINDGGFAGREPTTALAQSPNSRQDIPARSGPPSVKIQHRIAKRQMSSVGKKFKSLKALWPEHVGATKVVCSN